MSIITRGLGDPGSLVTRGLGGISVLDILGPGVVITVAEAAVLDLGIIEDLVTAIEEALAPVVHEFLTEEGLEIAVGSAATLSMSLGAASATQMSLTEEALTVTPGESVTLEASASESSLDVSPSESTPLDSSSTDTASTTITTDESNAGE